MQDKPADGRAAQARPPGRGLASIGALYAAAGVALSAYAAHAALGEEASRLQTAALFAFGHGAALSALAHVPGNRSMRIALSAIAAGVLLFSGSLAGRALMQWPSTLAPFGGVLLIAGWLLYAVGRWH